MSTTTDQRPALTDPENAGNREQAEHIVTREAGGIGAPMETATGSITAVATIYQAPPDTGAANESRMDPYRVGDGPVAAAHPLNRRRRPEQMAIEVERQIMRKRERPTVLAILYFAKLIAEQAAGAAAIEDITGRALKEVTDQRRASLMKLVTEAEKAALISYSRAGRSVALLEGGAEYIRLAIQTRIALWRVNPEMSAGEVCEIVEGEESDYPLHYAPAVDRAILEEGRLAKGSSFKSRRQQQHSFDGLIAAWGH